MAQSLAHATGFSSQWQNIGKIQNKGIELSLSSTNIQTKDFNWQTNFNISFIKNTLEALSSGEQYRLARSGFDSNFTGDDYIAKVGESLGLIYGYEFDGIYQADDFYTNTNGQLVLRRITDNTRYSGGVKPGVVKYKDQDGDGKITTADRTVIGNAMPKWFGGITNTLEYKGIDFSFMFQFNYGNDIYNATRLYATQSRSSRRNMLAEVADRWSPTNASNLVRFIRRLYYQRCIFPLRGRRFIPASQEYHLRLYIASEMDKQVLCIQTACLCYRSESVLLEQL